MCCKSWRTLLSFLVTLVFGVLLTTTIQSLKTERRVSEVSKVITHSKEYSSSAACSEKSHSTEINCFACQNGTIQKDEGREKLPAVNSKSLQILSKPIANYTDAARTNQVQGTVTLRVTFLASGKIGQMGVVKSLPDGLTEQALVAAMKIKFEPAKRNGVAQTVTKQVQYSFTLY